MVEMRIVLLVALLLAPLASAGLTVSSPAEGATVAPDFVVEGRFEEEPESAVAGTPGFLGRLGDVLLFEGEAPPAAHGLGLHVREHVPLAHPIIRYEEVVDEGSALPPGQAVGIQPGSHITMSRPDGTFGCTANYIWRDDDNQKLYLGAAGHCFLPEDKTATHGSGADYDPSKTSVDVCVASCQYGGQLGFIFTGTLEELGPVVYARQTGGGGDVGNDFGVVEIPESLWDLVDPAMAVWGGPTGTTALSLGTPVVHFGNAAGLGEHYTTQARSGIGGSSDSDSWVASTPSNSGDSGSAVNTATPQGADLAGDEAVGILTHLSAGIQFGFVAGTTMPQAVRMAEQAGLRIAPVFVGDDIPGFSGGIPAPPVDVRAAPLDGGARVSWSPAADGPEPSGYVVRYGEVSGGPYSDEVSTEAVEATVSGLANGATYYFVVHSVGDGGESEASREVSVVPTAGMTTPGAPRALAALAAEGAVDLTWDPPTDDGGSPITGYTVRWTTEEAGAYRHSMRAAGTEATVDGLAPDTQYFFVVHARNEAGEGPASNEAQAEPFAAAAPERVVEIRLDGGTWQRVDEWDGEAFRHLMRDVSAGDHVLEAQAVQEGRAVDAIAIDVVVAGQPVAEADGKASPGVPMLVLLAALAATAARRRR